MILAAVGKNASGKDFFLEYLGKKYNIPMISIGDIARDLASAEGLEHTRENLHHISQKYMMQYGQTFFPQKVAEKIRKNGFENVLVSGIRPLSDVMTLKEEFGSNFILIAVIVTDDHVRYERMQSRASARDPQTFEEFQKFDEGEEKLFQTSKTLEMADYIILNNGTANDLFFRIDAFYDEHLRKYFAE